MLTDAEIASMQSTSELAMAATVTVTREATTPPTFNPQTGTYGERATVTVYEGSYRLRPAGRTEGDEQVGDLHETPGRYVATFPASCPELRVDDFVTPTDGTDADLIGRPMRVVDVHYSEWLIDRRVTVEDLQQVRPT